MNRIARYFQGWDWWLVGSVLALVGFGVLALVSSSVSRGPHELVTQAAAIGLGLVFAFVLASTHPASIHRLRYYVIIAAVLMLVAVLVLGRTIKGTRGWFIVGPASFQPVEFAKLSLIVVLAAILPLHARLKSLRAVISASVITAIFVGLVLLQPDLGSALVLVALWCAMLVVSGAPRRYIIMLFVAAVIAGGMAWRFGLHDYQRERILIFLDPSRDPLGRGYNVTQAQIAVGSGGLLGSGFASGTQSQLRFLPESQTDFVFSLIVEEFGFLAASALLAAFGVLIWRLWRLALSAPDDFSQFLCAGSAALVSIEAFIAVGGNIGIVPMTGITLPFVSAGGSSVVAHFALIGLAIGVSRTAARSSIAMERGST